MANRNEKTMNKEGFRFIAKQGYQTQEKLDNVMSKVFETYSSAGTGKNGCIFEKLIAQVCKAKGIDSEFIQNAGKMDLILYAPDETGKKRQYRIEVKTGSGIVAELPARLSFRSISDFTDSVILPKATHVIYSACPENLKTVDDILDKTGFFARKDFIDFVCACGGTRKSGFSTCFSVQCNNNALVKKNQSLPEKVSVQNEDGSFVTDEDGKVILYDTVRTIIDKKTGDEKTTRRGCPRWTDCVVMQTSYLDSRRIGLKEGLKSGKILSLRQWLESINRI